jgi:SET domain-containing protein
MNVNEQIEWLLSESFYRVGVSNIAGKGTFATSFLKAGTDIGVAFRKKSSTGNADKDYSRTELGAMTNHSSEPNMNVVRKGDSYHFVTKVDIVKGTELTVNYNQFDFEGKRDFAK